MTKHWPKLQKPPVVMVICQVVFDSKESVTLSKGVILSINKTLSKTFVNTRTDLNLDLSAPLPLGESTVKAGANTKVYAYVYHTEDQKKKLEVALDKITYTDETAYTGFEDLKATINDYLTILSEYLTGTTIKRVSIRFINRFSFNEFDNATDYFKTVISSTDNSFMEYPIVGYGFKWLSKISDDTRAIVNQELNSIIGNTFDYLFDIDVLCDQNLIFDKDVILSIMNKLREVKNDLFFSNLTEKTIKSCNS